MPPASAAATAAGSAATSAAHRTDRRHAWPKLHSATRLPTRAVPLSATCRCSTMTACGSGFELDDTGLRRVCAGMTCDAGDKQLCCVEEAVVVPDVDCTGSFGACSSTCNRSFTVAVPASGEGALCPYEDGFTTATGCAPGDGACPPNIDCSGGFSKCSADCDRVFTVAVAVSGGGTACDYEDQLKTEDGCSEGIGSCPAAVPVVDDAPDDLNDDTLSDAPSPALSLGAALVALFGFAAMQGV